MGVRLRAPQQNKANTMVGEKRIQSALISVYYKDGLEPIVRKLNDLGVKLYSTGGTQSFIEELGIGVTPVEDLTQYPSILGGRVKTLHPKIFGGILARRANTTDIEQMAEYAIPAIDLVIVDLYPFEQTVAQTTDSKAIIEKIDIGGISLIRAAAKNFEDVLIIASRDQYAPFLDLLETQYAKTSLAQRKYHAALAFAASSHYDTAIFNYFNAEAEIPVFKQSLSQVQSLRYGENPHQQGRFFGPLHELFDQIQGKEVSYNNLLDIDAAVNLLAEFDTTTFAILKHTNACGVATRPAVLDAYLAALACDPVSAFGGILATNAPIDASAAEEIAKLFCEVLIAPAYDEPALEILSKKKNLIVLVQKLKLQQKQQHRSLLNGVLVQDKDLRTETPAELSPITQQVPTPEQVNDLLFANKIVKHTKSNAIVLAKNGQLCASGVGQTSRVDALRQAIDKAQSFGFDLQGAVLASDAFFPFADSVELAHKAGIEAIVQPGGSKRDQDSIDYCNQNGLAMVFTGVRHFKH